MATQASTLAKYDAWLAEVQAIGGAPPPPLPQTGDPAWFLARPGKSITNIGNTIAAVDPCPGNQCAYSGVTKLAALLNDTGMIYAEHFGSLGSLVVTGGGHNDYYGNEVYRFDIATSVWSRLTNPSTAIFNQNNATNQGNPAFYWKLYHADRAHGELWVDGDFASHPNEGTKPTRQDQPGAGHMFGYQVYLPPGFGHNDPQGALLTCCRPVLTPIGSAGGAQSHILPFSNPVWSRFSTNLMPDSFGWTGAFLDAPNRRVLAHLLNSGFGVLNLDTKAWSTINVNPSFPTYLNCAAWNNCEALGVWAMLKITAGAVTFYVVDATTKARTAPGIAGTFPNWQAGGGSTHGGSTWAAADGALWYYPGDGGKIAYRIAPSGNPRSTQWTSTPTTFAGDQPAVQLSPTQSFHMKRFLHVPAFGGFFWLATTTAPVQFWRE